MKIFKPGSQLYRLICLISVCGEFPVLSLHLLGNKRLYRRVVSECTVPVTIQNFETKETLSLPKIFNLIGKGRMKSIRLYKGARPILRWIGEGDYYDSICYGYNMPMTHNHIDRNHRVAECIAAFMDAGYSYLPHSLPRLKTDRAESKIHQEAIFYPSRILKFGNDNDVNKTGFSRITGAAFAGGECYAVYNTRDTVMKWSGKGETKALAHLSVIAHINAGIHEFNPPSILFGASQEVAFRSMLSMRKATNPNLRFELIVPKIHFVPLNEYGARFLKFFTIPKWREHLLELLFDDSNRSFDRGMFVYDATVDDTYIFSHLDSDLCRLNRFREPLIDGVPRKCEIICFDWQKDFVKKFIGNLATVNIIDFDVVEKAMSEYYK